MDWFIELPRNEAHFRSVIGGDGKATDADDNLTFYDEGIYYRKEIREPRCSKTICTSWIGGDGKATDDIDDFTAIEYCTQATNLESPEAQNMLYCLNT